MLQRAKRLTRYLIGTTDMELEMIPKMSGSHITVYVDSDWADDFAVPKQHKRRHITSLRSEGSKLGKDTKQHRFVVMRGRALCHGHICGRTLGLRSLLSEIGCTLAVHLHTDSSSAKAVAARCGSGTMKHIELHMLAIQDWVAIKLLYIFKVPTEINPSDLLTKPMTAERNKMLINMLGLFRRARS